jgi:hypothetical protein
VLARKNVLPIPVDAFNTGTILPNTEVHEESRRRAAKAKKKKDVVINLLRGLSACSDSNGGRKRR